MAACPAKKHARASRRVLAGDALFGSTERHPMASPPPEPIASAMSYHADLVRASRLMPLVKEGFAASLTEAATRFAISHSVMGTILVGMAPQQFEDALAAVQKGPLPHAALERLTALQQGIRRRGTVIVEICRASPVNGPQAPTRRSPAFTPALGSGTPTVSSGGQLVGSIEFVGHYAAGNHFGRAIGVIIVFRIAQRPRK